MTPRLLDDLQALDELLSRIRFVPPTSRERSGVRVESTGPARSQALIALLAALATITSLIYLLWRSLTGLKG